MAAVAFSAECEVAPLLEGIARSDRQGNRMDARHRPHLLSCAAPPGLRSAFGASFPALKRCANKQCAYGASGTEALELTSIPAFTIPAIVLLSKFQQLSCFHNSSDCPAFTIPAIVLPSQFQRLSCLQNSSNCPAFKIPAIVLPSKFQQLACSRSSCKLIRSSQVIEFVRIYFGSPHLSKSHFHGGQIDFSQASRVR